MKQELLRVENIYGYYIKKTILDQVTLNFNCGEIICLFGLNNSGKTTLVNILSGLTNGTWKKKVYYCGRPASLNSPEDSLRLGISCIQSTPKLFSNLSVAENLYITQKVPLSKRLYVNHTRAYEQASKLFEKYQIDFDPRTIAADLSLTDQFILEILRATNNKAKIIVLDCINHFSTVSDITRLKKLLYDLKKSGISILYTCSKFDSSLFFADRTLVIRQGLLVKEFKAQNFDIKKISLYAIKHQNTINTPKKRNISSPSLLHIINMRINETKSLSFNIKKGEILGINNPDKETLYALAKCLSDGDIDCRFSFLNEKPVSNKRLSMWLKKKCCVAFDLSMETCLFPNLSILENLTICIGNPSFHFRWFISQKTKRLIAKENSNLIHENGEERDLIEMTIANNITIYITRLLLARTELVVFFRPVLDFDDVSKNDVYMQILRLTEKHASVIILSDEVGEMTPICNRILTF